MRRVRVLPVALLAALAVAATGVSGCAILQHPDLAAPTVTVPGSCSPSTARIHVADLTQGPAEEIGFRSVDTEHGTSSEETAQPRAEVAVDPTTFWAGLHGEPSEWVAAVSAAYPDFAPIDAAQVTALAFVDDTAQFAEGTNSRGVHYVESVLAETRTVDVQVSCEGHEVWASMTEPDLTTVSRMRVDCASRPPDPLSIEESTALSHC